MGVKLYCRLVMAGTVTTVNNTHSITDCWVLGFCSPDGGLLNVDEKPHTRCGRTWSDPRYTLAEALMPGHPGLALDL